MVLEEICFWVFLGDCFEGFLGGFVGGMSRDCIGAACRNYAILVDRDNEYMVFKDI